MRIRLGGSRGERAMKTEVLPLRRQVRIRIGMLWCICTMCGRRTLWLGSRSGTTALRTH